LQLVGGLIVAHDPRLDLQGLQGRLGAQIATGRAHAGELLERRLHEVLGVPLDDLAFGVGALLGEQARAVQIQVNIRLSEVPLTELVQGLNADLFDAGFAMIDEVEDGIVAQPLWADPLVVALPARHPLLAFKEVPLQEVLSYPLVLCDPRTCQGCCRQRERLFRSVDVQPIVAEYAASHGLMLTLVAAGYGLGFSTAAHLATCQPADVVVRPLAGQSASLTTYLLRTEVGMTEPLQRFIERAERVCRQDANASRAI